jgi:hypothetical protein
MRSALASRELHKVVPVVSLLFSATGPVLPKVVEDGFSLVEVAALLSVFLFFEGPDGTAWVSTDKLGPAFRHHRDLFDVSSLCSCLGGGFFLFCLFVKVGSSLNLGKSLLFSSLRSVSNSRTLPKLLCLSFCRVTASTAALNFLESFPIGDDLVATGPSLFEIVENRLSVVEFATKVGVLTL